MTPGKFEIALTEVAGVLSAEAQKSRTTGSRRMFVSIQILRKMKNCDTGRRPPWFVRKYAHPHA